ncbi:hypothetical protein C0Q70_04823 [Pomacea canaliculata]|uniref:Uncharacterized protein n=1 Tax=Pomacea canaliculata TaxID=400727 RepID=A0A2T7PJG0_POMCA|nr:hypothetical protein C0Q70_04823 [Pomacea canaliculata]
MAMKRVVPRDETRGRPLVPVCAASLETTSKAIAVSEDLLLSSPLSPQHPRSQRNTRLQDLLVSGPRSRAQAARADDVNHPGPVCERHVQTESVEQVVVLVWHREDDDDCEEEDSRWRGKGIEVYASKTDPHPLVWKEQKLFAGDIRFRLAQTSAKRSN